MIPIVQQGKALSVKERCDKVLNPFPLDNNRLSQICRSQILIRSQLQLFQDASEIVDRCLLSETVPQSKLFQGILLESIRHPLRF